MPESVFVEVEGADELSKLLKILPDKVEKVSLRKALNAAANPCMRLARAKARRESGLLQKSINKKIKTYQSGAAVAIIGPRKSVIGEWKHGKKMKKRWPAKYAQIVEKHFPFLEPAYQATKTEALQIATDKLRDSVIEEAEKVYNPK